MRPTPYSSAKETWQIIRAIEHSNKLEARNELVQELYEWLIQHPDASASALMDEIEESNRRYARKSI